MNKWLRLSLVLILVFSVAFAIACGSATEPPDEDIEPDPDTEPDPEPVEPEEPQRVVIAQATDAFSWDPPQDWISAAEWVIQNAYDYLFVRSPDGGDWIPELAKEWEVIDELTFRFYLHEGVKFHDGTELTAEDVKFHYRRVIEGSRDEYIVTDQYDWIDKIVIHDDYTFDVVSKEPNSLFLWQLSQQNTGAGIVSKAYFEEVGIDGVHRSPMGSGPWVLEEHVRDEHILFSRNEDYWQTDKFPNFQELEYRIIPEASTRVAEILTGGVDLIYDVTPQDKDRLDANPDVTTYWNNTARGHMLTTRVGPRSRENYPDPDYPDDPELNRVFATADPRVRDAIEMAIDKYALRDISGGDGEPFRARGPFGPLAESHAAVYGPDANVYDPDGARALLEEGGYGPGEPTLVMHASEAWPYGDIARVIGDMLEQVGFTVDLRILDTTSWRTDIYLPGKSQELNLMALGGQMNPFFSTSQIHTERLGYPEVLPPPPEMDPDYESLSSRINELLDYAWTEVVDEQGRIDAYHEATALAAERNAPFIGLVQMSTLYAWRNRVEYQPRFDIELWGYDFKVVE